MPCFKDILLFTVQLEIRSAECGSPFNLKITCQDLKFELTYISFP